MDLEVVAARALSDVKGLLADVDEAETGIDAEDERIEAARQQIEDDASRVSGTARELVELAEESRQSLEQEGLESAEALDGLSRRVASVHTEALQLLDAARVETVGLSERIASVTPRLEGLFDRLDAASQVLRAGADQAAAQVEKAVAAVHAIQTMAAGDFHRFEEALEQRLEELRSRVEEACVPTLQTLAETWADSLEGIVANTVARGFTTAAANLDEVSAEALNRCRTECAPLLEEVALLGGRMEGALERLGGAVQQAEAALAAGAGPLEGLRETEARLEAASAALERVKATLARYTFVTM